MDKQDLKILDLLQKDGALPAAQIAERVALSKVPCWRRIQRMQDDARLARLALARAPGAFPPLGMVAL